MRIPNYRFTTPIKAQDYWSSKKRSVDKIRGDEFSKELEESLYKKESETKKKNALPT